MDDTCPLCGGRTIGDGYSSIIRCENADPEDWWYSEPDADPVYCDFEEDE